MERNEDVQLRVALYLRVSTDEQADKYGLDAQRAAIEGLIKSKGKLKDGRDKMVLAGKAYEYIDDGVSGTVKIDERPEFTRLKEDILNAPEVQKPFDLVAVYRIDRFARKLRILMDVLNFFEEFNIEFISASESIDTSTPFGRAMLGIMGVIAELELETIKQRTQSGREQAILEGVFMGGHTPYGYQKDEAGRLAILEDEAKIVERIFLLFTVDKLSPQRIADILTSEEVLSPDASAVKYKKHSGVSTKINSPHFWRAERIKDILADEIYIGIYYTNKSRKNKKLPKNEWKQSPYKHNPIILTHIFELAQQRLVELSERKTLSRKKESGHIYPLSGLLKCDYCRNIVTPVESEMMSWTGIRKFIKETQRYSYAYTCNRKNAKKFSIICPSVPIPAEPLEEYIINFIKQLLSNPQAVYEYQRELASTKLNTKHLENSKANYDSMLNAIPLRRERIREQHKMLMIDTPTLQKELKELEQKEAEYKDKVKELDYQLSQITLSKGYEESLKQFSKKYGKVLKETFKDEKELYDLIHMLIYQIVVYSRPRGARDKIAGRPKDGQMIPEQIDIILNLPQNLLRELYRHKFAVKNAEL